MSGLFTVLSGSIWKFVVGWMLPTLAAVSVFAVIIFPAIDHLPLAVDLLNQSAATTGLIIAFSVLLISVPLAALSTPIYRLLEGYSWPRWARRIGIARQRRHWTAVIRRLDAIENVDDSEKSTGVVASAWERELVVEGLQRFPENEADLMPTRLGNALKAIENYAPAAV